MEEIHRLKGISGSEYVFTDEYGRRMNTSDFDRRLETACKQCGIIQKSCHKFRKTYVSILLDNHVDENLIRQQVGHVDITTSEKFYHRNRKSIEKKSKIISDIEEFRNLRASSDY